MHRNSVKGAQLWLLDLKNPVDVLLVSRDGITVHIGLDDELERKLTSAGNALSELEKSGVKNGLLDVDLDGAALYSPRKAGADAETPPDAETPVQPETGENSEAPESGDNPSPEPDSPDNGGNTD